MQSGKQAWADQTFGDAKLGDARRTARLVKVGAQAAARPAGRLTRVFERGAAREAAFRLVENDNVDASEIARASHRATARRCTPESMVYVPIDSTSLCLVDKQQKKFGRIGPKTTVHRGIHATSALAVDMQGKTLGTTALRFWVHSGERAPRWQFDKRLPHERESSLWNRAVEDTLEVLQQQAPGCVPWFQMDRAADFADVLRLAYEKSLLITVRAAYDRAIESGPQYTTLWPRMKQEPVLGYKQIRLPAREHRLARIVELAVRAKKLRFRVADPVTRRRKHWVELYAVYVVESEQREDAIEWMLWTTYPVQSFHDACRVITGYTMRWRIEDYHRAWKKGCCDIESSQLRSVSALQRWSAITAPVAARAEHLKHLSRTEPERDALLELSRDEIDAAIILTGTKKHCIGDALTLQQAVWLVAQVGGYMNRRSDGPPGSQTIARGLEYVAATALGLAAGRRSG
jgi:hypothetical protein